MNKSSSGNVASVQSLNGLFSALQKHSRIILCPFHSSKLTIPSLLSPPSLALSVCVASAPAVQEERQRNREREEGLEFSVGVNEEMPVEKILEAETAVEQKTELHTDGGSAGNSVSSDVVLIRSM